MGADVSHYRKRGTSRGPAGRRGSDLLVRARAVARRGSRCAHAAVLDRGLYLLPLARTLRCRAIGWHTLQGLWAAWNRSSRESTARVAAVNGWEPLFHRHD